jgi:hypothetical protein
MDAFAAMFCELHRQRYLCDPPREKLVRTLHRMHRRLGPEKTKAYIRKWFEQSRPTPNEKGFRKFVYTREDGTNGKFVTGNGSPEVHSRV